MSLSKPSRDRDLSKTDEDRRIEIEENKMDIWHYFNKSASGNDAKCKLCSSSLKISKGSYKGLKTHLEKKHFIFTTSNRPPENRQLKRSFSDSVQKPCTSNFDPKPGTSNSEQSVSVPKKKLRTLDSYVKCEDKMETMISRMVCKDGFPLSAFCTSSDLRHLFWKSGFQLPNSPNTIRSLVTKYAETVKANMIVEFNNLKKQGQKFALTFDEWTKKNHRYMNLNVHHKERHFNLGLIRIHGSCTAEHSINIIKERLMSFELDLYSDIIGITTDGAKVMVKVGKLLPCFQQLCFAHGIQLAIVDVLYKNNPNRTIEEVQPDIQPDTDTEDECDEDFDLTDEEEEEPDMTVTMDVHPLDLICVELIPEYNPLLQKVRKVVKIFKKSPTKYDLYLQKYVREEMDKELSLILDCRTRWNSLLTMIERFYLLKVCIDKSLIDIKSNIKFTDVEWSAIKDLIDCLQPFKLAVEALCRRDATLLTAETSTKFILEKLGQLNSCLSRRLAAALRERIMERRSTIMTGILIYINNPKKYDQNTRQADVTHLMPKKNAMRQEMKKILQQMSQDESQNVAPQPVEESSSSESDSNLTLKEELQKQIMKEKEQFVQQRARATFNRGTDIEKILKKEMSTYEVEGVKGKNLSLLYDLLITIKPTSVEAERAFSAAGYICSSLRSRLGDNTINTICFLRSFFQTKTE